MSFSSHIKSTRSFGHGLTVLNRSNWDRTGIVITDCEE